MHRQIVILSSRFLNKSHYMFSNQFGYLQAIAGLPPGSGVPDREWFLYQLL